MARKKVTKPKATQKATQKTNSFATIQKMEKEFFKMPATLAKQLKQETMSIKKSQSTLKATLAKIIAQHKANKGKTLSAKAKKAQKVAVKLQKSVEKELNTATKTLSSVQMQQTKLVALRKHLSEFDKVWAKEAKAAAAKAKAKAKTVKKTKVKTKVKANKKAKSFAAMAATETFMDFQEPMNSNMDYANTTEEVAS